MAARIAWSLSLSNFSTAASARPFPICSNANDSRSVICHYAAPTPAREPDFKAMNAKNMPSGESFKLWSVPADSRFQRTCPSIRSSQLLTDSLSNALPSSLLDPKTLVEPKTFDSILHLQVCHIIGAYGKYVDDISVRYFQGVHRWLPVISRHRFHDRLVNFQDPATADFSILLLTMCLITSQPALGSEDESSNQETLYLTTKMLFAHAQAFNPNSTNMIQAALLIATYEYAHGMSDAAYISIGTCARMAFAAGLQKSRVPQMFIDDRSRLKDAEEKNLWWGIVICER